MVIVCVPCEYPCINHMATTLHLVQGAVRQAPSGCEAAISPAPAAVPANVDPPTAKEIHGRVNDGGCPWGRWTGGVWLMRLSNVICAVLASAVHACVPCTPYVDVLA